MSNSETGIMAEPAQSPSTNRTQSTRCNAFLVDSRAPGYRFGCTVRKAKHPAADYNPRAVLMRTDEVHFSIYLSKLRRDSIALPCG